MHDREKLDAGVVFERFADAVRVDRFVVRHGKLDRLAAIFFDEQLEPLSEDPRDEVEHFVARRQQARGRGLESEDGLGLHDDDVILRSVDLLQQLTRVAEYVDEGGIVVIQNGTGLVSKGSIRELHGAARERHLWPDFHDNLLKPIKYHAVGAPRVFINKVEM